MSRNFYGNLFIVFRQNLMHVEHFEICTLKLPVIKNVLSFKLYGSMSASGSSGPGFDPRRGSKFSFENFQPRG